MLSRGEHPGPHMVPSLLIPVSLRGPGEEDIYENRVSVVVADLPVHLADPLERLAAIRTEISNLKAVREASAAEALFASPTACRKLVEIIPYVPIATSLRTGVSVFSYCGQLTFGLTGD